MHLKMLTLATLALVSLAPSSLALQSSRPAANAARTTLKHYNLEKNNLAIDGYDPVSYFPEGGSKPKEGSKKFEATHRGVRYRFMNEKNRAAFLRTPDRFEPAYGGWCSYAMTGGDKVEVDEENFLIQEGRLLLFYNGFLSNTRKKWNKEDPQKLMPKSDSQWSKISGEKRGRVLANFNLNAGLAIQGYDPVAYFGDGMVVKGDAKHAAVHAGVTYRFASEANKATFLANANRYEPQFGGWCAWAMAQGKKVEIDSSAYAVDGDKLYLFYNASKRDEWLADKAGFLSRAAKAWKKLEANS